MKKKITIVLALLTISFTGFCKIWTVTVISGISGYLFYPGNLTILEGDTVDFQIGSPYHNAVEVDLSTWNAGGSTALNGGFQTNFGGGMVLPTKLKEGTHYYVCQPHAAHGMKAQIVVNKPIATGVEENKSLANVIAIPNPSSGVFQISLNQINLASKTVAEIYNVNGELVSEMEVSSSVFNIDLSKEINGIYFIKIQNGDAVTTKKVLKN
jgi:plastocyanin